MDFPNTDYMTNDVIELYQTAPKENASYVST